MPLFTNEDLDTNVNGAGAAAVNIQDGGNSITIDATALPLPTGAATAALQTQPGVDIGDVTVNNASGAAAVNIQDGGNSITIDATSLPLPTGAATETTLAAINTKTPALGQATMANSSPVVIASNQSAIPVTIGSNTTTATVTSVSVSTTVATLSASNAAKTSVIIFNEAGTLFVKLGSGATSASYTYRLTANTALEVNGYAGIITGIKQTGTSAALVTEVGI